MAALLAQNISKTYVRVPVLQDVTLSVGPASVHCLAGENGSGKSTLIKIISGTLSADAGNVIIDGHDATHENALMRIELGLSVIYQDFSLLPNLSVFENITFLDSVSRRRKFANFRQMKQLAQEKGVEIGVCVLEKGSEIGAHIVSGAVMDPRALDELIPDWKDKGAPLNVEVTEDRFLFLSEKGARQVPNWLTDADIETIRRVAPAASSATATVSSASSGASALSSAQVTQLLSAIQGSLAGGSSGASGTGSLTSLLSLLGGAA